MPTVIRRQAAGGGRQEAGGGRQEAGSRRQVVGHSNLIAELKTDQL